MSMFFDIRKYYKMGYLYNFFIGARGCGKTFSIKETTTDDFLATGEQFVYARRYDKEIENKKLQSFYDDLWKEKSANIVDEASKVTAAERRQQAMQQAEDTATASNVKALEQANALGDASVGKSAEGAQSDAYLNARAKAASEQTDRAIGLARLFGKQGAIGDAMQNQGISAMDNMLKSQGLDFQNRQQRRGFEGAVDLLGKQSNSVRFDSSAGQAAQSLGGLFTSAGMQGVGQAWGQNSGFKAFQNKG